MDRCPHCNDPHLVRYSSLRKMYCTYCERVLPWDLKPGQQPIVTNNRAPKKRPKAG